ncbi:MAG: aromatic amino acid hydroxylase [Bdellovibrio sp.]|nr:aromatic amino acid hydroxylase [Bdellovibrio sp.]
MSSLPNHLQKYVVEQNYEKYTPLDQAVWRYVLRQLSDFLGKHAHPSYLVGLKKTSIEIEEIPRIENISQSLEKFGWQAVPVSGFIPPAAFMELQSLSILPIASDMRSIDHLQYTAAPDIVHEAAGHAPFLADVEYANYLKQYAQVAKKAILSKYDLQQYEAIRELSDIKANPTSNIEQIQASEDKLKKITEAIGFTSEAAELGRMNWWTAEYGLIGDINSPKIFGAGLLSSVGESKLCLSDKVKKIPLTLDCVYQTYDITEKQPQLYVAKNFTDLGKVLNDLSETMAYKLGGKKGLDKAIQAETINTVEFENHLQISGLVKKYLTAADGSIAYLQFQGPTQISFKDAEVTSHGSKYHAEGYGTPLGAIKNFNLASLKLNEAMTLTYESGLQIEGTLKKVLNISEKAVILTFEGATCEYQGEKLFLPAWGLYDIVLAQQVVSVFGGPADRAAYGEVDDFVASRVPALQYNDDQKKIFGFYEKVRALRANKKSTQQDLNELFLKISQAASKEWLLFVELVELGLKRNYDLGLLKLIEYHLGSLIKKDVSIQEVIEEGLRLAHAKY